MSVLIRKIAMLSAIGYGINILEMDPPGRVTGVGGSVVGIVGDFPWGPVNTPTQITSTGQLFSTFCPTPFDAANSYPALRAFLNKQFPGGLTVVRIAATSAAVATLSTAGTGGAVVATARYAGAIGNRISIQFTTSSDAVATSRDVIVSIGSTYSQRYKNQTIATIASIVDPYVTITVTGTLTAFAAAGAAVSLATGVDGTAAAADYVGSISSNVGIRRFYATKMSVGVLIVAECPSALVDAVNSGLQAYSVEADKGMTVLSTAPSIAKSAIITSVAGFRDDRTVCVYPRAKTVNGFDPLRAEIAVDGNAFVAAAIVSVDPERSPGGAPGAPALYGITNVENDGLSTVEYDDLNAAGIAPLMMVDDLGCIIRKGITTSLVSGKTQISRRRMTDYIVDSIAKRAQNFSSEMLTVDLDKQALGGLMSGLIGEIQAFLGDLKGRERIKAFSVDPFSGNTQTDIDAGRWYIVVRVKLYSAADEIVIQANIGEGVVISEAA